MDTPTKIWQQALKIYRDINSEVSTTTCFNRPDVAIDVVKIDHSSPFGVSQSDVKIFYKFTRGKNINSIFIIGNAFGWSTVLLALMFPKAIIDVIDAELEGDGPYCTEIAKKAFNKLSNKINLYIGKSPEDISKAVTQPEYDLIFIDGHHTPDQIIKDYEITEPYQSNVCTIFLHDIGLAELQGTASTISDKKINDNRYKMHKFEISTDNVTGMWVFEKNGL